METKIQVKSKALRNVKGDHMQIILPNSESKTGARFDPRFDSEIASLSIWKSRIKVIKKINDKNIYGGHVLGIKSDYIIYNMYMVYWMVWRWIYNLFHEWDRIFVKKC